MPQFLVYNHLLDAHDLKSTILKFAGFFIKAFILVSCGCSNWRSLLPKYNKGCLLRLLFNIFFIIYLIKLKKNPKQECQASMKIDKS